MWRCANCGASIPRGTLCPSCGILIDAAVDEISRKIRRGIIRRDVASRWGWRGAAIGFLVGSVLTLIFGGILVVRHLVSPGWQETMLDVVAILICVFVMGAVIFLPLLFAVSFLVFGTVVRPILIALFCSIERFEREYGSSRP